MSILENHLKFVNEQLNFQQKTLEKVAALDGTAHKVNFHKSLVDRFNALRIYLMQLKNIDIDTKQEPPKAPKLSLTPQDIHGLPEELLKELSIGEDSTEFALLKVLEDCGGVASLDQLLVGVYKKTGEVLKRQQLTSRLYRMGQKDLIWGVPGKKGVYSNKPITENQASLMFGEEPVAP